MRRYLVGGSDAAGASQPRSVDPKPKAPAKTKDADRVLALPAAKRSKSSGLPTTAEVQKVARAQQVRLLLTSRSPSEWCSPQFEKRPNESAEGSDGDRDGDEGMAVEGLPDLLPRGFVQFSDWAVDLAPGIYVVRVADGRCFYACKVKHESTKGQDPALVYDGEYVLILCNSDCVPVARGVIKNGVCTNCWDLITIPTTKPSIPPTTSSASSQRVHVQ